MNTLSHSVSPVPAIRAAKIPTSLRLVAVGLLCALATWLSIPRMTRYWTQTAEFVDQLHIRATLPDAPLPPDGTARHLIGWNGR